MMKPKQFVYSLYTFTERLIHVLITRHLPHAIFCAQMHLACSAKQSISLFQADCPFIFYLCWFSFDFT